MNGLKTLLKSKHSFLQYAMTVSLGGLAFLVDISVFWALTFVLTWHYLIGTSIGMICGFVLSYAGSKYLIFPTSNTDNLKEFYRFFLVFLGGLALNNALLWALVEYMSLYAMTAKIISTVIISIWNFLMRKHFVFTGTQHEKPYVKSSSSQLGGL